MAVNAPPHAVLLGSEGGCASINSGYANSYTLHNSPAIPAALLRAALLLPPCQHRPAFHSRCTLRQWQPAAPACRMTDCCCLVSCRPRHSQRLLNGLYPQGAGVRGHEKDLQPVGLKDLVEYATEEANALPEVGKSVDCSSQLCCTPCVSKQLAVSLPGCLRTALGETWELGGMGASAGARGRPCAGVATHSQDPCYPLQVCGGVLHGHVSLGAGVWLSRAR